MTFNPGRLPDISRYTAPQPIVPGADAWNDVRDDGNGRPVPVVGFYPPGTPTGLSARLGGDFSPPLSPVVAATAIVGVSLGLWWLSAMSRRRGRKS